MSGENTVVYGATKVLESAGILIANNALAAASALYGIEADGAGFPDAEFVLTVNYSTTPTDMSLLSLYARPMDVDGDTDTDAPDATRPNVFIGAFQVDNRTGAQTLVLTPLGFVRDLPRKAEYYIHNNGTGQAVQAGWVLKVTPRSNKAAP
ncbi:hypothetical protein [Massilia brevitalea]|uniref:hypothetical protein n=1 Tax=Massilia brevitalea TaxID=442526 RepID=UPI002738FB2B|nr:hypothetical protein [Massilia brevitalea]